MADVFLSYSREDRAAVEPLAERLVAAGYSVWWDRNLSGGTRYLDETETQLNTAKVVLVAWSKTSITSHWVADEAGAGRDTGRLLPISLDGSIPPLGFRQFQVIDFAKWTRDDGVAMNELIAALVKMSAPTGEAMNQSSTSAKKTSGSSRRLVLSGIAAAVVALIAASVYFLSRTSSDALLQNDRTAFFGYTTESDDPQLKQVASAVTDETFSNLSTLRLDVAARTETRGVKAEEQVSKATDLGAQYLLGGDVRALGDDVSIAIHLVDTASRATIWQVTLEGEKKDAPSRAIQAAVRAPKVLQCLAEVRPGLEEVTPATLGLAAQACDATVWTMYTATSVERWRAVAQVAPRSVYVLSHLSGALMQNSADPNTRAQLLEEFFATWDRIVALSPDGAGVHVRSAFRKLVDNAPIVDVVAGFDAAVDIAKREGTYGNPRGIYLAVGRPSVVARDIAAAYERDPLDSGTAIGQIMALRTTDKPLEALRQAESAVTKTQDVLLWYMWSVLAVPEDDAQFQRVLAAAPAGIASDTLACIRQHHEALLGRGPPAPRIRGLICGIGGGVGLVFFQQVGDLDGAFAVLTNALDRSNPQGLFGGGMVGLFSAGNSKVRADPRFLELMRSYGIYQYWLDTGTHPEVCDKQEERDFPVCAALRKDQERK